MCDRNNMPAGHILRRVHCCPISCFGFCCTRDLPCMLATCMCMTYMHTCHALDVNVMMRGVRHHSNTSKLLCTYVQGQSPALAESAQTSLNKAGVIVRNALVERVAEGRSVASNTDLGKKITMSIDGKKQVEESDLVLWTAGTRHERMEVKAGALLLLSMPDGLRRHSNSSIIAPTRPHYACPCLRSAAATQNIREGHPIQITDAECQVQTWKRQLGHTQTVGWQ